MPKPLAASRLDALRKILDLERAHGYNDSAVVGGLDRFLAKWAASEAGPGSSDGQALRGLREAGLLEESYASLDSRQRALWMGRLSTAIERSTGSGAQPTHRPPAPRKRPAAPARPAKPKPRPTLASPVAALGGVSSRTASLLTKLGVHTVRDLLYFFPNRHIDYSRITQVRDLSPGEEQTVSGVVWEARTTLLGGRRGSEAVVGDDTGNFRVVWFNQPHMARSLRVQSRIALSGRVNIFRGALVMENPEHELLTGDGNLTHTGRLVPVYPLTEGLTQRPLRRLVKQAVDGFAKDAVDPAPPDIIKRNRLMALPRAIQQFHYPDSPEERDEARRRLAFDELFMMQLAVLSYRKLHREAAPSRPIKPAPGIVESFLKTLPFSLTSAQGRVLGDLMRDIAEAKTMTRLLQGEVGSGKTVLALAGLLAAAACGFQGAFLAPTEVLAEQHFLTVERLLEGAAVDKSTPTRLVVHLEGYPRPVVVGLLLGGQTRKAKTEMHRLLSEGGMDIAIGTHALIQEGVDFPRLAFVVIDEQHRFGVRQRAALREKGGNPHMLVMSATPIPRSLALTLYGDLDLSTLDEMPRGRLPVKTRCLEASDRDSAYRFLHKQVREGHQAFIVCPLIEESEAVLARAATEEYERLAAGVYQDLRLGLLHGRMSLAEKGEVMDSFRRGDTDILVCTPVIEVGIDVPNATAILIEGANRFGLSQLHQLRGRVGRGKDQGYCILMAENASPEARERLDIVERANDGFSLAEEDLRIRGPGDHFGTRQSGLPQLRVARLSDTDIMAAARKQAAELLERDSGLSAWPKLQLALEEYRQEAPGDAS